ncbi:periplasmic nitrate reductase, electron transfer subunit [Paracoccus acridae]|jgi:cytochrome c-type protein NapB|uniref:Periplasmic nitrate reductase, electron transfer subunit n=2 Tax=Paracoccus TaxID=265 RepID=A0A0F6RAK3_9RHOB|nr:MULTISPECIES: nitrate reductase cytochrome c-type subunit [Paracoccus]AKE49384.1 periplasmic nitrate reductase small subunit diheme cytochrome c [Paracoccus sp. SY]GGF72473.1 periplasmic nitrate reductase, electron transfer subunit [Paracoccus acridae]
MGQIRLSLVLAACFAASFVMAQNVSELSGPQPDPMQSGPAAPIPRFVTDDVRQMRAYPEQPPIIPHSIEGYQLSVNTNRCMSCHTREMTQGSGAPMISITHYMTREGQMLADVSPRRYFCTQCHVPQADAAALIENTFTDMSEMGATGAGRE